MAGDVSALTLNRHDGGRLMIMTPGRVLYFGLLGKPTVRNLGSLTVYISLDKPFLFRKAGAWQEHDCVAVDPYVPHEVATNDKLIGVILVEPESVGLKGEKSRIGWVLANANKIREIKDRVRNAYNLLTTSADFRINDSASFDAKILGEPLPQPSFDARIAGVVLRISEAPDALWSAEHCADETHLSVSRFLHLFKEEIGVPFRVFVAWKRARSFLGYVQRVSNLTDVALEVGYADATHFSHSIRKFYGLTPKDIFAGSRSLAIYGISKGLVDPLGTSRVRRLTKKNMEAVLL